MVMTFILHPLSHYNTITEPHARLLLSLIKDLSIDFSSPFIFSLIDVYRNTMTGDKLIFPSAITRIVRPFSVSYPPFDHFFVMVSIDGAIVRRSDVQLRPRWTQTKRAAPSASSAPPSSAPFSFVGGVTLEAILA